MSRNPLDLPLPLVVDNLLPLLSNRDLASLRSVSKQAKALVEDQVLWKRKVLSDFTFPSHATARVGGWYNLYTGLSNPQVYVWGQTNNGRLGIPKLDQPHSVRSDVDRVDQGIPYPIKLDTLTAEHAYDPVEPRDENEDPLGAVVEIIAGGWSFHARTSTGRVLYWGTMDGEFPYYGPSQSLRFPSRVVVKPRVLTGVSAIKSLSGGRCHATALTRDGRVLEWKAWGSVWEHQGLPQSITAPPRSETNTTRQQEPDVPSTNIKQLEAGWSFSAILTHTGQVWLWYSDWSALAFRDTYYRDHPEQAELHADPPGIEHQKCFPINIAPVQLPSVDAVQDQDGDTDRIVQIAAGEDFVIALTEAGTLHRMDLHLPQPTPEDMRALVGMVADADPRDHRNFLTRQTHASQLRFLRTRARWERLSSFERPQSLPSFDAAWVGQGWVVGKISHISAHFRSFVTFHTITSAEGGEDTQTLVLLGTATGSEPQLIPELQASGVIKVTMGDYHWGALTEKGEVLTWGQFAKGALGNWEVPWSGGREEIDEVRDVGAEGDEGERGWFSNVVALPQILRGGFQPRIGFAGRGGRAGRAAPSAAGARTQSMDKVDVPTPIKIVPRGGEGKGKPFAFDVAFAGWHSSALVMDVEAEEGG
ncbi:hypothetical protein PHSY_001207 [Pseudozyma hubeiensis SY62]|uniref:F-box domain-containing protein n=1 Tax=Pseudozyma hubeiensis (strain SY62) TaxID=1305764 RepID=R9NYE3_PSEHS|nr:hypothetical protein PHSY_001207 [Pseudozyma hubeiensis SY62]GAC93642.1 hypothetical protein PHSY_001207 [Pseudozyma hubeiensis SY62]